MALRQNNVIDITLNQVSYPIVLMRLGEPCFRLNLLTPWPMEPGGSMLHSQGLSNNSYPEPNQPNYLH